MEVVFACKLVCLVPNEWQTNVIYVIQPRHSAYQTNKYDYIIIIIHFKSSSTFNTNFMHLLSFFYEVRHHKTYLCILCSLSSNDVVNYAKLCSNIGKGKGFHYVFLAKKRTSQLHHWHSHSYTCFSVKNLWSFLSISKSIAREWKYGTNCASQSQEVGWMSLRKKNMMNSANYFLKLTTLNWLTKDKPFNPRNVRWEKNLLLSNVNQYYLFQTCRQPTDILKYIPSWNETSWNLCE